MPRTFSPAAVEAVSAIIERHADRGGLVDTRSAWRDLLDLPLDPVDVQEIVRGLERSGYLWHWGEQMVVIRPIRCPGCNRVVQKTITAHMHDDHPRRDVAWVEWAD
jgi:hypothetical protein